MKNLLTLFLTLSLLFPISTYAATVTYLVVAGGAGGGGGESGDINGGGAGGAGGFRTASGYSVTSGIGYTVTIGAGGVGAVGDGTGTPGTNGDNSVFDTITSTGGGRGGSEQSGTPAQAGAA